MTQGSVINVSSIDYYSQGFWSFPPPQGCCWLTVTKFKWCLSDSAHILFCFIVDGISSIHTESVTGMHSCLIWKPLTSGTAFCTLIQWGRSEVSELSVFRHWLFFQLPSFLFPYHPSILFSPWLSFELAVKPRVILVCEHLRVLRVIVVWRLAF